MLETIKAFFLQSSSYSIRKKGYEPKTLGIFIYKLEYFVLPLFVIIKMSTNQFCREISTVSTYKEGCSLMSQPTFVNTIQLWSSEFPYFLTLADIYRGSIGCDGCSNFYVTGVSQNFDTCELRSVNGTLDYVCTIGTYNTILQNITFNPDLRYYRSSSDEFNIKDCSILRTETMTTLSIRSGTVAFIFIKRHYLGCTNNIYPSLTVQGGSLVVLQGTVPLANYMQPINPNIVSLNKENTIHSPIGWPELFSCVEEICDDKVSYFGSLLGVCGLVNLILTNFIKMFLNIKIEEGKQVGYEQMN